GVRGYRDAGHPLDDLGDDDTADGARHRIAGRSKALVLHGRARGIAAKRAYDKLNNNANDVHVTSLQLAGVCPNANPSESERNLFSDQLTDASCMAGRRPTDWPT